MKRIKDFYEKHKQIIRYLLFGAITTVCSMVAWAVTMKVGVLFWHDEVGEPTAGLDILGSTTQWIVGVLVAFVTNKKFVFVDAEKGIGVTVRQLLIFSGSRVLTYVMEVVMNLLLIELLEKLLRIPEPTLQIGSFAFTLTARIWAKFITAVAVVIANYFISKIFVFKKKKTADGQKTEK